MSFADEAIDVVADVGAALCGTLHQREVLGLMMERVRDAVQAEACSVMLLDETGRTLHWEVALGQGAGKLETLTVPLGYGISGRVAETGEPIRIGDVHKDSRWQGQRFDEATGFATRSLLCVPIRARDRILGVIQVLNKKGGAFGEDDERLLTALAGMGGVAIENARLYENLEEKVQERTAELTQTLRELRETQAQLVQSEKMAALGDLVAGVAHEINTPLGAVSSNVDLTARIVAKVRDVVAAAPDAGAAGRHLERAAQLAEVSREACRRIGEIVRSLRNFARLDEAERKPADLHEGLESTLTLAHHLLKDRIAIRREFGELPAVDCHPNQINQVFLNLIVNAAQATEGTAEIVLRTRAAAGEVHVEVADRGCGIKPENLARIFDPGFTTKGVGVGTGLGLAISYRIVRDHGGRIEVESEVGRGSTFRVILPA